MRQHFGFVFAITAPRSPTASESKNHKHIGGVIRCQLTKIFDMRQIMPRAHYPPIWDQKLLARFTAKDERLAVYLSWRKAVKWQMEGQDIHLTTNPRKQQWVTLTRWSLTRVPLSDQATLYEGNLTEEVKFTAAVDELLADVLKKLNYSHRGEVDLDPPLRRQPHKKVSDHSSLFSPSPC